MKSKFIVLILLLMFSIAKNSQSQTTITTNVRPAGTAFLGWNNTGTPGTLEVRNDFASDINFFTNGTQKMTLIGSTGSTDGFLGIATTAPTSVLQVDGGGTTTPTGEVMRTIGAYNRDTYWRMLGYPASGAAVEYGSIFHLNGTTDYDVQSTQGALKFHTNGVATPRVTITTSGDVGVATTAPAKKMEIISTGGQLRLTNVAATDYVDLFDNNAGSLIISPVGTTPRVGILNTTPGNTLDVTGGIRESLPASSTTSDDFVVFSSSGDLLKRTITNIVTNDCGSHTQNFVPKYCSATSTIQNSQVYDNGSFVGINTTTNNARLSIENSGNSQNTLYALGTGTSSGGISATGKSYGIYATANGTYAFGGSPMAGVTGQAYGPNNSGTGNSGNVGVYGFVTTAKDISDNYGVYGIANADGSGTGTTTNYGIYGAAGNGDVNYAGYFAGSLYASTYLNIPSDLSLKTNIQNLSDALTKITQLQPVSFDYLTDQYPQMNLPNGSQIGFIAQDVESVVPEVASDITVPAVFDTEGNEINPALSLKGYKPEELIPVAIEGIKELKALVDAQQLQISGLQSQLDGCCGLRSASGIDETSGQTIELKNIQSPFLGQSVPNPHATQATIPYYIPAESETAQIIFTDELGRIVNTVDILSKGNGQLTLLTSQLEDGIYNYSLVIDGKVISTKKMVKAAH